MTPSELERYLARIDYRGPRAPALETLHGLTSAHTRNIPFENLDVLLGRRIELSEAALMDKLVDRRRGGYCFEQNGLFLHALTALGFEATPLSARVRLDRPREYVPPRTHMFLRVLLEGVDWITDVGVGGASLTAAIRFEPDVEQETPHETRRIVRDPGRFFHQARFGSEWVDVYEFTGELMPAIDREVANWFTSAHPDSHFKNRLIVARAGEGGRRYTLLDGEFKVRERNGHASARPLDADELVRVLADEFGLTFAPGTRFSIAPSA